MASAHIPEQSLLSYPSQAKSSDLGHSSSTKLLDEKRIYVGNLDSTIDEYAVVKLFSPFGKITKLDFMFHWHGPKKGTPRGYCFIEYENSEQAATAVKQMNRKPIKLKPLSVSLANMAPLHTDSDPQGRKRTLDPKNRPTAFSLLKTSTLQNASTEEKIKAMELTGRTQTRVNRGHLQHQLQPLEVPAVPLVTDIQGAVKIQESDHDLIKGITIVR
ncbi:hypothetical protein BGW38_001335 [Lunasporangiospora selenospora]|uniref:RRM domain-containing protein n=1 Tax=Lunasporangiospora selenospora TaxID=979761 RepID=A0A9P6FU31_9FUNG|nr:hypothetical protein BGW38_001335 [Lunasporangiospora selenospora]